MDRETVIEMILDPGRRPVEGTAEHQTFLACVQQSAELRAMYERQQAVWEALDLWEAAEPSPGFDRAVYEKIERSQAAGGSRLWLWLGRPADWLVAARPSFAAGLAALLLIAAAVITYQPRRGDDAFALQRSPRVETEYIKQVDQALEDIEMLADFEALALEPERPGRS